MRELSIREALREALIEEMDVDPLIVLMGEEVAEYDGAYKVSKGLLERFGPKRVIDTPISENGFSGLGIGAAMGGLRPIIELMTFNFALQAIDQIINSAAKMNLMSGGQYPLPIVFRGPNGPARMLGAQHSQAFESFYSHFPGLKVVSYSNPADAKGLLKSAIQDPDPVIFLESEFNYGQTGPVPEETYYTPLGVADVKREGTDVTIIAWQKMVKVAQTLAEKAEAEFDVSCEIIDPRTIKPLDEEALFRSVRKTNRVVIIEEGHRFCGVGAEIAERIYRNCYDHLDAPIERVTSLDVPMPYAEKLEKWVLPNLERCTAALKKVCYL